MISQCGRHVFSRYYHCQRRFELRKSFVSMNLLVRAATLGDIDTVRDMLQAREIDGFEP